MIRINQNFRERNGCICLLSSRASCLFYKTIYLKMNKRILQVLTSLTGYEPNIIIFFKSIYDKARQIHYTINYFHNTLISILSRYPYSLNNNIYNFVIYRLTVMININQMKRPHLLWLYYCPRARRRNMCLEKRRKFFIICL